MVSFFPSPVLMIHITWSCNLPSGSEHNSWKADICFRFEAAVENKMASCRELYKARICFNGMTDCLNEGRALDSSRVTLGWCDLFQRETHTSSKGSIWWWAECSAYKKTYWNAIDEVGISLTLPDIFIVYQVSNTCDKPMQTIHIQVSTTELNSAKNQSIES